MDPLTPPPPRTVESWCALEQKKKDLNGAGYFGKKDNKVSQE